MRGILLAVGVVVVLVVIALFFDTGLTALLLMRRPRASRNKANGLNSYLRGRRDRHAR